MDQQEIVDDILAGLQKLSFEHYLFTLQISEAQLSKQILQDIEAGKRVSDDLNRAIERLVHYDKMLTTAISCNGMTTDEIVKEITTRL